MLACYNIENTDTPGSTATHPFSGMQYVSLSTLRAVTVTSIKLLATAFSFLGHWIERQAGLHSALLIAVCVY